MVRRLEPARRAAHAARLSHRQPAAQRLRDGPQPGERRRGGDDRPPGDARLRRARRRDGARARPYPQPRHPHHDGERDRRGRHCHHRPVRLPLRRPRRGAPEPDRDARHGDPGAARRHDHPDGDQPLAGIRRRPDRRGDLRRSAWRSPRPWPRSPAACTTSPTRRPSATRRPRLSSSSIRSPATAWTTSSRPTRRPRTGSRRSRSWPAPRPGDLRRRGFPRRSVRRLPGAARRRRPDPGAEPGGRPAGHTAGRRDRGPPSRLDGRRRSAEAAGAARRRLRRARRRGGSRPARRGAGESDRGRHPSGASARSGAPWRSASTRVRRRTGAFTTSSRSAPPRSCSSTCRTTPPSTPPCGSHGGDKSLKPLGGLVNAVLRRVARERDAILAAGRSLARHARLAAGALDGALRRRAPSPSRKRTARRPRST